MLRPDVDASLPKAENQPYMEEKANGEKTHLKLLTLVAATALLAAAPLSFHHSKVLSLDSAEARVGRPLTPMSVAGVNRRVHRRAYYGAAADAAAVGVGAAAAYGAYHYPRCGYYPYPPCY